MLFYDLVNQLVREIIQSQKSTKGRGDSIQSVIAKNPSNFTREYLKWHQLETKFITPKHSWVKQKNEKYTQQPAQCETHGLMFVPRKEKTFTGHAGHVQQRPNFSVL